MGSMSRLKRLWRQGLFQGQHWYTGGGVGRRGRLSKMDEAAGRLLLGAVDQIVEYILDKGLECLID